MHTIPPPLPGSPLTNGFDMHSILQAAHKIDMSEALYRPTNITQPKKTLQAPDADSIL
jgi:hypothetical protein